MKTEQRMSSMILGTALLAGCGVSPSQTTAPSSSSHLARSTATASSANHSPRVSDFPSLIQKAMAKIPAHIVPVRLAPTLLPVDQASHGTTVARPSVSNGPTPGFQITLATATSQLAQFGATQYGTASAALKAAQTNPHPIGSSGQVTGHVSLGDHLVGTIRQNAGGPSHWTSITWKTKQWTIVVTNRGAQILSPVAKEVVASMTGATLPTPHPHGFIYITMDKSSGSIDSMVRWPSHHTMYDVNTNARAANPVQAAIELASSTEPYPSHP